LIKKLIKNWIKTNWKSDWKNWLKSDWFQSILHLQFLLVKLSNFGPKLVGFQSIQSIDWNFDWKCLCFRLDSIVFWRLIESAFSVSSCLCFSYIIDKNGVATLRKLIKIGVRKLIVDWNAKLLRPLTSIMRKLFSIQKLMQVISLGI